MKKIFTILVLMFLFCAPALAKELGYISVSSEITREVQPNYAQFNVTVEKFNVNQAQAIKENNDAMQKIITELKKKFGEENKNSLSTTSFNVTPQYTYKDGKQRFDRYVVKSTLKVGVENLSQLSELIGIAVSNGATTVDGLNFSLKNKDSYCDELLKQANNENLKKANAVASTMNKKVSGIKYINASCSQQAYSVQPRNKMLMSVRAEGVAYDSVPPIEKDTITIYANVNAEFYVK